MLQSKSTVVAKSAVMIKVRSNPGAVTKGAAEAVARTTAGSKGISGAAQRKRCNAPTEVIKSIKKERPTTKDAAKGGVSAGNEVKPNVKAITGTKRQQNG